MNVNDLTVQLLVAECKRIEKELDVYKKALEMACNTLGNYDCCDAERDECMHDCGAHITEHFLKKAREEE